MFKEEKRKKCQCYMEYSAKEKADIKKYAAKIGQTMRAKYIQIYFTNNIII